jgi:hypothetical protein
MADGGYQGNPEVTMPFRKPGSGSELPEWKTEVNTSHKRVRARGALTRPHQVLEYLA